MLRFNWEDPRGVESEKSTGPVLWVPNQPVPPVDVKAVRRRQKKLLPYLHTLRQAAIGVLRQIESDPRDGGQLYLALNRRPFSVVALVRYAHQPSLLQTFGPILIHDHTVVLPASAVADFPILNDLFPAQHAASRMLDPAAKALLRTKQKELGIEQRTGLGAGGQIMDRIVVNPDFLRFATHFIGHISKATIFDLRLYEHQKESNIASFDWLAPRLRSRGESPRRSRPKQNAID